MANPLARKLGNFTALSNDDRHFLDWVIASAHQVGPRKDLTREGEVPEHVHLILDGIACRYKLLSDGRRQIMAYLLPGDLCDVHLCILRAKDHGVATLTGCEVVAIPRPVVLEMAERPAIARALSWATQVDQATLREWVVNIGQRRAEERIAHLLCELLVRLRTVGLAGGSYAFPITQDELADAVGLSTVHVNRTLQTLRAEHLIALDRQMVTIPDIDRLIDFCGFNPDYLRLAFHGGGRSRQPRADRRQPAADRPR